MADFDSSLPVRTQNDGDVVVKVADATVPSQQMTVNSDGSVNVTDNGGSLTVDSVDLDIRDLSSAQDSVEVLQATHDNLNANANIQIGDADVDNANPVPVSDAGGSLTVDATDLDIRDLTSASDSVEVLQATHDNLNANANIQVGDADVGNANPVPVSDAGGSITVDATDLDIRDLSASQDNVAIHDAGGDELAINSDGSINVVISDGTPGDPVNSYNTATVAGGGSSNHDYTVTAGKTLQLNQVHGSASGKMKMEVQIETGVATNTFNTLFVMFNSTAETNMDLEIDNPVAVAAGVRVRVIRSNRDNQSQDLYTTISGYEI